MYRTLNVPGDRPRVLSPTTTTKMAMRMLSSSRAVAEILPAGLFISPALDILLALHVAEDDAQYPVASEIDPPTSLSPAATRRWINALVQLGLIEHRDDLLALSDTGHQTIVDLINAVYIAQRRLD